MVANKVPAWAAWSHCWRCSRRGWALFAIWLFSDLLSRAFDDWIVPLLMDSAAISYPRFESDLRRLLG